MVKSDMLGIGAVFSDGMAEDVVVFEGSDPGMAEESGMGRAPMRFVERSGWRESRIWASVPVSMLSARQCSRLIESLPRYS